MLKHTALLAMTGLLLTSCGGGGDAPSGAPTPTPVPTPLPTPVPTPLPEPSPLLKLGAENRFAAPAVAVYAPISALYVSGDLVKLPSKAAAPAARALLRSKQAMQKRAAASAEPAVEVEVEKCAVSGEIVIEYRGDVATVWFKACRETQAIEGGGTAQTEQTGWARYSWIDAVGYDEAYVLEEQTTFAVDAGPMFSYVEKVQTRARLFQKGERLKIEDMDFTREDRGSWAGVAYDYIEAAQRLRFEIDPLGGAILQGRVGGWGTHFTGGPMLNGMLDVATAQPLFFDADDFPVAGEMLLKGAVGTSARVALTPSGYRLRLNQEPEVSLPWE
ncbi:hypothetical protein [Chitinilyticum litopenaei]|uniref:hypothetical protein n=1 Tax=Chitinilyticum litopenaei TaxID=1121276 RepID=UPI0003FEFF46|nr:hypothetical protein [Chitinilyticum litopenaei]